MSNVDHRLNIVVTQVGMDQVTTAFDSFGKTSTGVVQSQDALAGALGKTQGAALKTGQEFQKTDKSIADTGKTATTTSKSTMSLGDAFKSSALQITAFASGIVSTIGQFISYQKTSASLEKQDAILEKRWLTLGAKQKQLAADIKSGAISTEEAAKKSKEYELVQKSLEAQTDIVTAKHQQQTLSLVNLASTVLPTVINGISSLNNIYGSIKGTLDTATASTDAASTSTEHLGTVADTTQTVGIIPMIKNFAAWVTGSQGVNKALTDLSPVQQRSTEDTKSMAGMGNILIDAFKKMGSSIKNFATNIKTDMGNATGTIDKVKAGFVSFFSQLGSGFSGLGSALKTAGKAIKDFASSILSAFMSNPILGVITAIGAAIIGLIFNVGGFRDRLNELGVTLGKMAPWAKPFLDALGWMGERFAQIGDWIMGTDHLASATTAAGQAARKAADDFDTHFQAIQRSFIISKDFAKFEGIVENLNKVKTAIADLTEKQISYNTTTIEGLGNAANAFELFNSGIIKGVGPVDAKVKELQATFEGMRQGTISLADGKKLLTVQLAELDKLLVDNINTSGKQIAAEKESAIAMKGTSDAMTEAEKIINGYNADIKTNESLFTQFVKGYTEGNFKIIEASGASKEEIEAMLEKFKKEFPNGAIVVKQFGQDVVVSLDTIKERFGGTSKDITAFVDKLKKDLGDNAIATFADVIAAMQNVEKETNLMKEISALATSDIADNDFKLAQAILDLAEKYGISAKDIQKVVSDIIKAKDKENEATDKQIKKAESLAETRQKEIQSSQALKTSSEELIMSLGRQVEVQGMTGDGLKKLIDIQDDTANAYGVAADSVGLWWAELEKSQAVEKSEREILIQFARDHQVTLPDAIRNGSIKAMKDYIAEATGMAEATEDAAERAAQAFDSLSSRASSAMENLIQEDVVSGDFDKVIEKIEEAGSSIDVLSAKQAIIKPFLDDTEFKDGVQNLNQILNTTWAQAELNASGGGQKIVDALTGSIIDHLGSGAQPVVDHVNQIWAQVQASNEPGTAGSVTVSQLLQAIDKPTEFLAVGKKLIDSSTAGVQSGTPALESAGVQAMVKLLAPYGKAAQDAYIASVAIADKSKEGIDTLPPKAETALAPIEGVFSAAFLKASTVSTGILNSLFASIYDGLLNLTTNTQTQLDAILSLWTDHSTNVGTVTENIKLNLLLVQQTFSDLSTNVDTYTTSMTENINNMMIATTKTFNDYVLVIQAVQKAFNDITLAVKSNMTSMTTYIENFSNDSTTALDKVNKSLLLLQTNVSSTLNVWEKALDAMGKKVETFAKACETAFGKVGTAAKNATTEVNALQKAIDALKDKTVTITTVYKTQGSPAGRFGGATAIGGFARSGDSWIQSKPARIGGMNVGEFSKPELITATPLTNPYDVSDKTINLGGTATSSRGGSGSPIVVTGDLHVTVQTQSGETLAKQVKPFLLNGFSGIT